MNRIHHEKGKGYWKGAKKGFGGKGTKGLNAGKGAKGKQFHPYGSKGCTETYPGIVSPTLLDTFPGPRYRDYPRQKRKAPPKGWTACLPMGSLVEGTLFLPMKVPLDPTKFNTDFSPDSLLDMWERSNKGRIGTVVDLTNTDKYYPADTFPKRGIAYIKMKGLAGHGVVPSGTAVEEFVERCQKRWAEDPSQIIAVHCTHGKNRTGFMIVSYLIRVLGLGVSESLRRFNEARPPRGLSKAGYIDYLYFHQAKGDLAKLEAYGVWYPSDPENDDETRKDSQGRWKAFYNEGVCCPANVERARAQFTSLSTGRERDLQIDERKAVA